MAERPLYPHPLLAREGWLFIALATVAALAVGWFLGWGWSIPLWLIVVFIVQFFRDPARTPPAGEHLVVSPADGRIVSVERLHDPYLKRDSVRLSVFMNVFNVHSNRSPVDGEVREVWYSAGTFFNAALDKAAAGNERNALWLRTERGVDVVCVQVAGLIARRILCYVESGAQLARGQRYGFIRFGSRVDVYLEPTAKPRVAVGDVVAAAETVIAEFI